MTETFSPTSLQSDASSPPGAPSNEAALSPTTENSTPDKLSRRNAIVLGLTACGAALALTQSPARALSIDNPDAQALRFLEELEALQSDFFTRALMSIAYDAMGGRERDVISLIAQQDREHREWFRLVRNKFGYSEFARLYTPNASQSRPPRMFSFPSTAFRTPGDLWPMASRIKDLSVGAYHDLVGRTDDPQIIEAIAALAGVEARHAAVLHEVGNTNPLPSAFESASTTLTVSNQLAAHGFKAEVLP